MVDRYKEKTQTDYQNHDGPWLIQVDSATMLMTAKKFLCCIYLSQCVNGDCKPTNDWKDFTG